jgi:class 3 adenylate cyclase
MRMSFGEELRKEVDSIIRTRWATRKGNVVPEAEDVQLGNDAVKLEGTVLYADLADSSGLVKSHSETFAAEIYKSFLVSACRIVRQNDGEITAFDGDRVMAVFIGSSPNTAAAKAGLQLKWAAENIITPKIKEIYKDVDYKVRHAVGIDKCELFVARTGIRGSNDLVWVGVAANFAAKLCALREQDFTTYITDEVFIRLHESVKLGGNPKRSMWEQRAFGGRTIHRSNWRWSLD